MTALAYTVLKPFRADVDGDEIQLLPGEQIPGPRVPSVESWGRSIDHLLNTHHIAAVQLVGGDGLDEDALLARLEATVDPGRVLARFSDELLTGEMARRGLTVAQTVEGAAGGEGDDAAGEGGAGADAKPEPPAATRPRAQKPKA